ncbi:hypothetical protein OG21DRAFT_1512848, partial [Imleria badia]
MSHPSLTLQSLPIQVSFQADPKGWTKPAALDVRTDILASMFDAPSSSIKNILEERDRDHYIFSYNKCIYLFSSGSDDTYQIESPRTQKELGHHDGMYPTLSVHWQ